MKLGLQEYNMLMICCRVLRFVIMLCSGKSKKLVRSNQAEVRT